MMIYKRVVSTKRHTVGYMVTGVGEVSRREAVRLTKAISAITIGDYDVDRALAVFNGAEDFSA